MHPEIFCQQQVDLLKYLLAFKRKYYLVGGTAIALHLGHRRSIDFDLFTSKPIEKSKLRKKLIQIPYKQIPIFEDVDQLHIMVNEVKLTFFYYPFQIDCPVKVFSWFKMPDLLTLAAMKAFALSRRAKWKDYVDLYFIIKDHFSIVEISQKGKSIYGDQYAEKLFRQQLAFHKDIDYSEAVEYLVEVPSEHEIREFLIMESVRF
jgi:hypothetical protein